MKQYNVSFSWDEDIGAESLEEARSIAFQYIMQDLYPSCIKVDEIEENEELSKVSVLDRGSIKFHT